MHFTHRPRFADSISSDKPGSRHTHMPIRRAASKSTPYGALVRSITPCLRPTRILRRFIRRILSSGLNTLFINFAHPATPYPNPRHKAHSTGRSPSCLRPTRVLRRFIRHILSSGFNAPFGCFSHICCADFSSLMPLDRPQNRFRRALRTIPARQTRFTPRPHAHSPRRVQIHAVWRARQVDHHRDLIQHEYSADSFDAS